MNYTENIVDVIQSKLDIPFEPKYMSPQYVDKRSLHQIGLAAQEFYENFETPDKPNSMLRPYFPRFYEQGARFAFDVVFSDRTDWEEEKLRSSFLSHVKKNLLYCHQLCFHDPLIYILDYFRTGPNTEIAAKRFDDAIFLLKLYAEIAPLIRQGIVIPLSDEVVGGRAVVTNSDPRSSEEEKEFIMSSEVIRASKNPIDNIIDPIIDRIKRQIIQRENCSNNIDLFFPTEYHVDIMRSLILFHERLFTRKEIIAPLNLEILGRINSMNPNAISIREIIEIRQQEQSFDEFRTFLGGILEDIHSREREFTDLDKQFLEDTREKFLMSNEKLMRSVRTSGILREAFKSTDNILVGAMTGALAVNDVNATLLGAAIGAIPPAYGIVRGLISNVSMESSTMSLRNHFLAIGVQ